MTKVQKRRIRRIARSINKHLQALCYLTLLSTIVLGIIKLVYESGMLLILDMLLSTIF